jgi:flagellin
MAMVVQHNMTAANSNRQLGITTSAQAKSSEKLSSGYRINRAGDDAAGLKISEKMRSQIRGLDKASSNAQDGVSLIQTAEGALNEAHSILQRMNELAVQGANDTNESIDRDAINEELTALTDELDRISSTTQFNKQNLLDGTFTNKNLHVGANTYQKISISIDNMNATTLGLRGIQGTVTSAEQATPMKGLSIQSLNYKTYSYTWDTSKLTSSNVSLAISQIKASIAAAANSATQYVTSIDASNNVVWKDSAGNTYAALSKAVAADVSAAQMKASTEIKNNLPTYLSTVKVSATSITVNTSQPVGSTQVLASPDVSNYSNANLTLKAVQEAINKVSSQRSALGALQNRLEHTIANLDNVSENTQSAESRIRDTDMASEMVTYSKNNILAQAGQSMLAQSNQSTQGVLSLLQ